MLGKKTGKYDIHCNSCQTHVGNALRNRGIDVPTSVRGQFMFIRKMLDN